MHDAHVFRKDAKEFPQHEKNLRILAEVSTHDTKNLMHDDSAARKPGKTRFLLLFFIRDMNEEKSMDTQEESDNAKEFSMHEKGPRVHAKDSRHDKRTRVHDNDVFVQHDPAAPELRENPFLQHFSPNDMHPGVNEHKKTPRVHNQASRHRKRNLARDDGASLQDDSAAPELHGARFVPP